MDSAAFAAYELIAISAISTTAIGCVAGCVAGYFWGSHTRKMKELVSEEEIQQIFPPNNPLEWDHLPIAEREQTL